MHSHPVPLKNDFFVTMRFLRESALCYALSVNIATQKPKGNGLNGFEAGLFGCRNWAQFLSKDS